MPPILNYVIHLLLAAVLLAVFFKVYTWVTPYDEVELIRRGNRAAAMSLGGAMGGFSLTVASSLLHTGGYREFFGWAAGALMVQLLAYLVTTRGLRISREHIESDNAAFGGLMGCIALCIGAINAACIS